jgi:orotate phosphoribosyltransferase
MIKISEQDQKVIDGIFARSGAVITDDHFVYAAGHHGPAYIAKDALFRHPRSIKQLVRYMVKYMPVRSDSIDCVIGPVVGGAILSSWLTYVINCEPRGPKDPCLSLWADKDDEGKLCLKRGFDKDVVGKRVVIPEDIINSGKSVKEVVDLVLEAGAEKVGVVAMCNRGGVTQKDIGASFFFSLKDVDFIKYDPEDCPLCKDKVPVNTDYGHGAEFLKSPEGIAIYGEPVTA